MAVQFNGGVVIGADSRTTNGSYIANRVTDKLTPLAERIYCCRSGSAADTQALADIVKFHLESLSVQEGQQPQVKLAASLFQKLCYHNKNNLMAGIIVAGWDKHLGGTVYSIPLGGSLHKEPFAIGGSGSAYIYGYCDANFKENMSKEECVQFVSNAIYLALSRDGSSGGVIRLAVIDQNGVERRIWQSPGDSGMSSTLPAESERKLFRDDKAKKEEKNGTIKFQVFCNDGSDVSMKMLTGVKNIFQKQLPKMPKEYISRLVYDENHKSLAIVSHDEIVVGAICFRVFADRGFLEIVFCAVASSEQVKGYGSYLMNKMKQHARNEGRIGHFLTYADNYAVGYFKKQGFSKEITLDKSVWAGYIKDYDGGTLMECKLLPKINYLEVYQTLHLQKQALLALLRTRSNSHIVRPALKFDGKPIAPALIPGVIEAGWTPEMEQSTEPQKNRLYEFIKSFLAEIQAHAAAWPFLEPVNPAEVTDYYEVIKEPMDLATMESKIEKGMYICLDDFVRDLQLLVDNCKIYNQESTQYHKCALLLEEYFKNRLKIRQFKE